MSSPDDIRPSSSLPAPHLDGELVEDVMYLTREISGNTAAVKSPMVLRLGQVQTGRFSDGIDVDG